MAAYRWIAGNVEAGLPWPVLVTALVACAAFLYRRMDPVSSERWIGRSAGAPLTSLFVAVLMVAGFVTARQHGVVHLSALADSWPTSMTPWSQAVRVLDSLCAL